MREYPFFTTITIINPSHPRTEFVKAAADAQRVTDRDCFSVFALWLMISLLLKEL
jgi:hypothetical protein